MDFRERDRKNILRSLSWSPPVLFGHFLISNVLSSGHGVSERSSSKARVGQINFVNCLPVVLPIVEGRVVLDNAETVFAAPAQLNAWYADGSLDLGAMSSFHYLACNDLELLHGLSISSDGPVGSVLLFASDEFSKLNGKVVQVPQASATSVNLMKVLLWEAYGVKVETASVDSPAMPGDKVSASLIFGDHALKNDELWSKSCIRADLGKWWKDAYNLPMIYGLWAARKEWLGKPENQAAYTEITAKLLESLHIGLTSMLPNVIDEAVRRTELPRAGIESYYLRQLNFEMTPRHLEGLEIYRGLCQKLQLISKD